MFGRGSELTLKASTNWASISLDWHFINLAAGALSPFDRVEMKMKVLIPKSARILLSFIMIKNSASHYT